MILQLRDAFRARHAYRRCNHSAAGDFWTPQEMHLGSSAEELQRSIVAHGLSKRPFPASRRSKVVGKSKKTSSVGLWTQACIVRMYGRFGS